MTSDLLEENQELRKQVEELKDQITTRNGKLAILISENERLKAVVLGNEEEISGLKEELKKWKDEWHYVKDGKDLPLEAGLHIRVVLHNGNEYICETDYYEPSEDEIGFGHLLIQLYSNDEWIDDNDVYAWKEIVPPELPKEIE